MGLMPPSETDGMSSDTAASETNTGGQDWGSESLLMILPCPLTSYVV